MKETKVWIDREFPQVYFDPKTGNEYIEGRPLILEDIKTHDRELVNKVCEKISNHFKTTCYISIDEQNIYDVLDQIQKEFEK